MVTDGAGFTAASKKKDKVKLLIHALLWILRNRVQCTLILVIIFGSVSNLHVATCSNNIIGFSRFYTNH
jgi:hypothetical protein